MLPPQQNQGFSAQPHPKPVVRGVSMDCKELGTLESLIHNESMQTCALAQLLCCAENRGGKRET